MDHRVRKELRNVKRRQIASWFDEFMREDGSEIVTIQPLHQLLQAFPVCHVTIRRSICNADKQRDPIDENAPRSDLRCGFEQQTIRCFQLLLKDRGTGKNDLSLLLFLKGFDVPSKSTCVPNQFFGDSFENHYHSGFIGFRDTATDEFSTEQGLSGAGYPLDQDDVARWDAPQENIVQAENSGPYKIMRSVVLVH